MDYIGAVQSIVTSGASNDSGMFETNLRDERFLPFEGAGAESTWKLDLPKDYRAFDYATISDVILHVRYTARQGVEPTKVKTALDNLFQEVSQSNLALLFSLRHDFPTEWSAFVNGAGNFTATIRKDYFPYFTQGKAITITGLELYGKQKSTTRSPARRGRGGKEGKSQNQSPPRTKNTLPPNRRARACAAPPASSFFFFFLSPPLLKCFPTDLAEFSLEGGGVGNTWGPMRLARRT